MPLEFRTFRRRSRSSATRRQRRRAAARVVGAAEPAAAGRDRRRARSRQCARRARGCSTSATTKCARRSASRSRRSCRRRWRSSSRSSARRTVPVVPALEGEPAPGFVVGRVSSEPRRWRSSGPRARVQQITEATTEPVSVDGAPHARARRRDRRRARLVGAAGAAAERDRHRRDLRRRRSSASWPACRCAGAISAPGCGRRCRRQLVRVTVRGAARPLAALRAGQRPTRSWTLPGSDRAGTIFGFRSTRRENFGVSVDRSRRRRRDDQVARWSEPYWQFSIMSCHRLFGTDGVRGQGGRLSARSRDRGAAGRGARARDALVDGGASGRASVRSASSIGRDTRESGDWIERELGRGVHAEGAAITTAGVIPTPAIAYVTRALGFDAGLVISASHNPFEDNGIKVFSGRGEKFTEALERHVEAIIDDASWQVPAVGGAAGRAHGRRRRLHRRTRGWRCPIRSGSGGSGWPSTPPTARRRRWRRGCSRELGFDVHVIGDEPDGRNINLDCGSTHPERLAALVREQRLPHGRRVRRRRRSRDLRRCTRDGSSTATPCCCCARGTCRSQGRLKGNARRRDRHEQHRPRARAARERHRAGALPGRRQVRDGGNDQARPVDRRRAVGPRHLLRPPLHRRRHRDGAQRAARDGRHRPRARRSGVGAGDLSAGAGQRARAREEGAARRRRRSPTPWIGSSSGSRARAGCWFATPAPSRCCAS